jgi:TolA-binding protein
MNRNDVSMIGRFGCGLLVLVLGTSLSVAQDVPGIEICTVEKTMERRTSCLQSNVEFLQKTITKLALDHQQKLDAAKGQIEALKANVIALQKIVDDLKAAQDKTAETAKKGDTSAQKDTAAKDATAKDGTAKGAAKEAK